MTKRKHSPIHAFWHPRVEGQIRDAMHAHPEWFAIQESRRAMSACVNSIAKRIVGEIPAVCRMAADRTVMLPRCDGPAGGGGDCAVPSPGGGVAATVHPLRKPGQEHGGGWIKTERPPLTRQELRAIVKRHGGVEKHAFMPIDTTVLITFAL